MTRRDYSPRSEAKREAGSRGGRATLTRHGRQHYQEIGRKGAATFWKRYRLSPAGTSDFAIVKRKTGEPIAFLSGRLWEGR